MWFTNYLRDKNVKKEMFLLVLSGCLLLAGCQRETESENQRLDIWDNIQIAVPDGIGDIEVVDIDLESILEKNSIQEKIMSGDFSCMEDEDWEEMQKSYERQSDVFEWRQLDLNGDGIEDLILQEKTPVDEESYQHRILGIFACGEDEARCVLWDDVYMGNFSFCGPTGELMEYYYSFGTMVDLEGYRHYYYDMEWNEITDYNLLIWYVDDPEGYTYPTEWFEAHPDMQEKGTYYRKYTGEDVEGEALTLEGLKEIFRTEMGMEIEYSR